MDDDSDEYYGSMRTQWINEGCMGSITMDQRGEAACGGMIPRVIADGRAPTKVWRYNNNSGRVNRASR